MSTLSLSWTWSDFADGWRDRFAESASDDAMAWGLKDQVAMALTALVETGLMRPAAKEALPRVRTMLYGFASSFIQVLRMCMIGQEPGLLAMTPAERREQIRKLYGGGLESGA